MTDRAATTARRASIGYSDEMSGQVKDLARCGTYDTFQGGEDEAQQSDDWVLRRSCLVPGSNTEKMMRLAKPTALFDSPTARNTRVISLPSPPLSESNE